MLLRWFQIYEYWVYEYVIFRAGKPCQDSVQLEALATAEGKAEFEFSSITKSKASVSYGPGHVLQLPVDGTQCEQSLTEGHRKGGGRRVT